MDLKNINSNTELQETLKSTEKVFVLLYKEGSEASECALKRLEDLNISDSDNLSFASVNVAKTRDIHGVYDIKSVPTLLQFSNAKLKNVIKGCMTTDYYDSLISGKYTKTDSQNGEVKQKRVTVYSTPSCVWCTRLKNYFREKNVKFTDINVAADQNRAEEMKRKSGQMGVPQTEIEGQMIVGFDKQKINRLLGIN